MRTIYLERVFCMSARAYWAVPSVILFRCLCRVLWRMFSTEGVVSVSGLYQLLLLEDVGTEVELFPSSDLALLDLGLDFVLSCGLPTCRRRSGQRVQFAGWLVFSIIYEMVGSCVLVSLHVCVICGRGWGVMMM